MSDLDSTSNKDDVLAQDDSFLDVDLIEVDDLLNSASRLLEEVYSIRPMAAQSSALSPREDAMQQVQRFLSSIREPEEEEDVVFVEARPGNAPPASARTTAVVDLCTPTTADENTPDTRPSRRRRRTDDIVPIEFPDFNPTPNCSNYAMKTRRRQGQTQPKPEPVDRDEPKVISVESPATCGGKKVTTTPTGPNGGMPALTCAVCMESVLNRQPTSTSCGHIFCQPCIMQAIRLTKKCPLCNYKLKPNNVHRVYF